MKRVEFKFQNGQRVKDLVSGLVGIIDMQTIILTGNIQYSVQPQVKEGENTKLESWYIDEDSLELIDIAIPEKGLDICYFQYDGGEKVKDIITEATGTITRSILDLNGCIRYNVQPVVGKDKKIPEIFTANEKSLISLGGAVNIKNTSVGGPSTRSNSARY